MASLGLTGGLQFIFFRGFLCFGKQFHTRNWNCYIWAEEISSKSGRHILDIFFFHIDRVICMASMQVRGFLIT